MKRTNDDSKACRDGGAVTEPARDDVSWMTNAGADDCRSVAATAPLWALVEAHRILTQRENTKTRSKILAGAMKRRFGVMAGSDAALVGKKGGRES